MVQVVNGKVTGPDADYGIGSVNGLTGKVKPGVNRPKTLGDYATLGTAKPKVDEAAKKRATNESLLKSLGLAIDTVLTPAGIKKRKLRGLRGASENAVELDTALGD